MLSNLCGITNVGLVRNISRILMSSLRVEDLGLDLAKFNLCALAVYLRFRREVFPNAYFI